MRIRKATKKDFKEIGKILRKESSKKPYVQKWTPKKVSEEVKDFAKNELFVSVVDGKIVGFIAANIEPDSKEKAYVKEIWLKPDYQGKGIGKKLVKHVESIYKKKGVKLIRLVSMKNAKAFGFYKKLKYKESKKQVFMEKKLR